MERTITINEFQTLLAAGTSITLLDVRRNAASEPQYKHLQEGRICA